MGGQLWYKLCEFKHRLDALKYQHEQLGRDLQELIDALNPLLPALSEIEDLNREATAALHNVMEGQPVRKQAHARPQKGDS